MVSESILQVNFMPTPYLQGQYDTTNKGQETHLLPSQFHTEPLISSVTQDKFYLPKSQV